MTDVNGGGFGLDRGFPTTYALSEDKEALIEAVTGTLWNFGYSAITGFDEGAGGRTSQLGQKAFDWYNAKRYALTNVRCITRKGTSDSLEGWILRVVMGINSTPLNDELDTKSCS